MVRFLVVLALMVSLFSVGLAPYVDAAPPTVAQMQAMRARNLVVQRSTVGTAPKSIKQYQNLKNNLASQQQMREKGSAIAGSGSNKVFRGASKYAKHYGGKPSDWSKMRSSSYSTPSGKVHETHWVQNQKTGKRYDYKTVIEKAKK